MVRSLPLRPSLRFLQEQAKDLHKAHQAGDASVCPTLRQLKRFARAGDAAILAAAIPLKEVQFALAMDYGFKTWADLKARITARPATAKAVKEGAKVYLPVKPMRWDTGEMCEFASALGRTLACVGQEVSCQYLQGVTGVAFRFTIGPALWNPGNYAFGIVTDDEQDLIRRAFEAVGYGYHLHDKADKAGDLGRIAAGIDTGVPVMLKGNVVDASDWVLINGYEGDVLIGTSVYTSNQGQRFGEYDVIRQWHEPMRQYIVLGERTRRPPAAALYADALRLAVRLVRTPQIGGLYTGLKAYEFLATALRQREFRPDAPATEFQPGAQIKEDTLGFQYLCLLCYNMMLDDRRSAAPFLRDAGKALPACEGDLAEAAERYDRACKLASELDRILPGNFSQEAQRRLLDPKVRDEYAGVLLAVRDAEAGAIACVERALSAIAQ